MTKSNNLQQTYFEFNSKHRFLIRLRSFFEQELSVGMLYEATTFVVFLFLYESQDNTQTNLYPILVRQLHRVISSVEVLYHYSKINKPQTFHRRPLNRPYIFMYYHQSTKHSTFTVLFSCNVDYSCYFIPRKAVSAISVGLKYETQCNWCCQQEGPSNISIQVSTVCARSML